MSGMPLTASSLINWLNNGQKGKLTYERNTQLRLVSESLVNKYDNQYSAGPGATLRPGATLNKEEAASLLTSLIPDGSLYSQAQVFNVIANLHPDESDANGEEISINELSTFLGRIQLYGDPQDKKGNTFTGKIYEDGFNDIMKYANNPPDITSSSSLYEF